MNSKEMKTKSTLPARSDRLAPTSANEAARAQRRPSAKKGLALLCAAALVLCLFAAVPQTANAIPQLTTVTAGQLATLINGFHHGGTGTLNASASGATVTVTGTVTNVVNTLELNIASGDTVLWRASYTAAGPDYGVIGALFLLPHDLIVLPGTGKFEVPAGGSVVSTGNGNAIVVNSRGATVSVSGGTVSAIGNFSAISLNAGSCTVNVSGGSVEGAGDSPAINAPAAASTVNISGGTVSNTQGHAIFAADVDFNCAISGGTVSSGFGCAVMSRGANANITVRNAAVTNELLNNTIHTLGANNTIEVGAGGTVSNTSVECAIYVEGANTIVNISGGSVSAIGGTAIASNSVAAVEDRANLSNVTVNVRSGEVTSEHSDAIYLNGDDATVRVSGGTVFGGRVTGGPPNMPELAGQHGHAIRTDGFAFIEITGGTVFSMHSSPIIVSGTSPGNPSGVIVNGGVVSSFNDYPAIYTNASGCSIVVLDGTVSSPTASAIWSDVSNTTITVSGGEVFSGEYLNSNCGPTIRGTGSYSTIIVDGGVVANYGSHRAIESGGATGCQVAVSGGFVFTYGKEIISSVETGPAAIYMESGTPTVTAPGIVCVWDRDAGRTNYISGTTDDLVSAPASATAKWGRSGDDCGINYASGANTGFFRLDVTVNIGLVQSPGLAQFVPKLVYSAGLFTDVRAGVWYSVPVALAYEYGLMRGVGDNAFNPTGNITVAEAITVATRVHNIYLTGSDEFPAVAAGQPWYQANVDYAIENGMIAATAFTDYRRPATRAEMAFIFSGAIPAEEFEAQNTVNSLPDVNRNTQYSDAIFMLYRAGVLGGSDGIGTFNPGNNISRAEAAAIISRVILPAERLSGNTFG